MDASCECVVCAGCCVCAGGCVCVFSWKWDALLCRLAWISVAQCRLAWIGRVLPLETLDGSVKKCHAVVSGVGPRPAYQL